MHAPLNPSRGLMHGAESSPSPMLQSIWRPRESMHKITFAGVADVISLALCCAGCKPKSINPRYPMSEEQPSRRSRMCAIRCRLFLLGYSSNIGYSLAYAFRPASGTAYSSSPRAPSPRVPPVAPCARPAMRDKTFACTPAGPTFDVCRPFDGRQNRRAGLYVSVESLGRSSLMGGGTLFPPCLRPFPPCGAQSPSLIPRSLRPCSSERANAQPSGVRASGGRARPATLPNCAGFPHPCAFPPLRGSLRSPLRKRLPAPLVGSATLRPRHASPRAGNMKRVGVVDDSGVQPKKTTRRR